MGLETLHISNYLGLRYPNWMLGEQNGGPRELQELVFTRCRQQGPPPQLTAFIHLQSLELTDCSWVALPGNMEHLTSLKVLLIVRCFKIRSLSTLPHFIEEFTLVCCDEMFMMSCENKEHSNWGKIKHIPKKNIIFPKKYPGTPRYLDLYGQHSSPTSDGEHGYHSPGGYDSGGESSGWEHSSPRYDSELNGLGETDCVEPITVELLKLKPIGMEPVTDTEGYRSPGLGEYSGS